MPEAEEMPGFPDAVGIGGYCVTIRYKHEAKQSKFSGRLEATTHYIINSGPMMTLSSQKNGIFPELVGKLLVVP